MESKDMRIRYAKGGVSKCGKTIRLSKDLRPTDNSRHQINNVVYCNTCSSRICRAGEPDTLRKKKIIDISEDFYVRV